MLTVTQLKRILVHNPQPELWLAPINAALTVFNIYTNEQIAAFTANVTHESTDLTVLEENLHYHAPGLCTTWPHRFRVPGRAESATCEEFTDGLANALVYSMQPEKIANRVYCARMGNGDEASGDGWKYRGRGPLQTTGHNNYLEVADGLHVGLIDDPDMIKLPEIGMKAAGLFWQKHEANAILANQGFEAVCIKINGGSIGIQDRLIKFSQIKIILAS